MSRVPQKAIGLLGGTFDPIHFGHLRLAEEIGEALDLAEIRVLPAGTPPHRAAPCAEAPHRRAMVERAIAGNPRLVLDARELSRPGPGYMVDTLSAMRLELDTATPIILIIGADAFIGLTTWHHWRRLFDLCHFAVAQRPGYTGWESALSPELASVLGLRRSAEISELHETPSGRIVLRNITPLDISASRIREDLAAGRSARYLLPDCVLDYIEQHRLYR